MEDSPDPVDAPSASAQHTNPNAVNMPSPPALIKDLHAFERAVSEAQDASLALWKQFDNLCKRYKRVRIFPHLKPASQVTLATAKAIYGRDAPTVRALAQSRWTLDISKFLSDFGPEALFSATFVKDLHRLLVSSHELSWDKAYEALCNARHNRMTNAERRSRVSTSRAWTPADISDTMIALGLKPPGGTKRKMDPEPPKAQNPSIPVTPDRTASPPPKKTRTMTTPPRDQDVHHVQHDEAGDMGTNDTTEAHTDKRMNKSMDRSGASGDAYPEGDSGIGAEAARDAAGAEAEEPGEGDEASQDNDAVEAVRHSPGTESSEDVEIGRKTAAASTLPDEYDLGFDTFSDSSVPSPSLFVGDAPSESESDSEPEESTPAVPAQSNNVSMRRPRRRLFSLPPKDKTRKRDVLTYSLSPQRFGHGPPPSDFSRIPLPPQSDGNDRSTLKKSKPAPEAVHDGESLGNDTPTSKKAKAASEAVQDGVRPVPSPPSTSIGQESESKTTRLPPQNSENDGSPPKKSKSASEAIHDGETSETDSSKPKKSKPASEAVDDGAQPVPSSPSTSIGLESSSKSMRNGEDVRTVLAQLEPHAWLGHSAIFLLLRLLVPTSARVLEVMEPSGSWEEWAKTQQPFRVSPSTSHVLVPLHQRHRRHWVLVHFDLGTRQVSTLDSLRSSQRSDDLVPQAAVRSLAVALGMEGYSANRRKGPQQRGAEDCGIHVLVSSLYITAGLPLPQDINPDFWRLAFRHLLDPDKLPPEDVADALVPTLKQVKRDGDLLAQHGHACRLLKLGSDASQGVETASRLLTLVYSCCSDEARVALTSIMPVKEESSVRAKMVELQTAAMKLHQRGDDDSTVLAAARRTNEQVARELRALERNNDELAEKCQALSILRRLTLRLQQHIQQRCSNIQEKLAPLDKMLQNLRAYTATLGPEMRPAGWTQS
ncbi:hypothetical protein IWX47DRAFT_913780 [Phyllosticta citricarpa]